MVQLSRAASTILMLPLCNTAVIMAKKLGLLSFREPEQLQWFHRFSKFSHVVDIFYNGAVALSCIIKFGLIPQLEMGHFGQFGSGAQLIENVVVALQFGLKHHSRFLQQVRPHSGTENFKSVVESQFAVLSKPRTVVIPGRFGVSDGLRSSNRPLSSKLSSWMTGQLEPNLPPRWDSKPELFFQSVSRMRTPLRWQSISSQV